MARLAGFEPTTPWFVAKYSIQLSYSRTKPASIAAKNQTSTIIRAIAPKVLPPIKTHGCKRAMAQGLRRRRARGKVGHFRYAPSGSAADIGTAAKPHCMQRYQPAAESAAQEARVAASCAVRRAAEIARR